MRLRLRHLDPDGKFAPHLKLAALTRLLSPAVVADCVAAAEVRTVRERKLSLEALVWVVLAMCLFAELSVTDVFERLSAGLRFLWSDDATRATLIPTKGALCQRRYQLRARPLARLFARVCHPLATRRTPGAFLFDFRLMAIDSHFEDVPDTAANDRCFGRCRSQRGDSAFPQVLVLSLCELGTHAVVAVNFWPAHASEHRGLRRLLAAVTPEMLVLADRGLYEYGLIEGVQARGGHVLLRLPAVVKPRFVRHLTDGSALVQIPHPYRPRRKRGEHLLVRRITYTLTDPQAPGYGETYTLITTLLDPKVYPAHALACAYHERWEIELMIDEQDTHQLGQHLPASPLRSRKPVGVIQELYALQIAHYAIRFLMYEAALQAQVDPDRLSFTHALHVIQEATWQFQIVAPELLPGLYRRLLEDLARECLPEREPRAQPRAVKRKVIKWPLKRLEHRRWRQPTRPFEVSVRLI